MFRADLFIYLFLKRRYRIGRAKAGDASPKRALRGRRGPLFLVASGLIDVCESCASASSGKGFFLHGCGCDLRRRRTEEPSLIFVPASLPGVCPANMSDTVYPLCVAALW